MSWAQVKTVFWDEKALPDVARVVVTATAETETSAGSQVPPDQHQTGLNIGPLAERALYTCGQHSNQSRTHVSIGTLG